jgi:transcriptional regulator with XRE-family HTH domain
MRTHPIKIDMNEVERAAAGGLSQEELAAQLGISLSTLHRRKRDNEDFVAAIERGRAKAHAEVSAALMGRIRDGEISAIIWYEKTRKGYSDRNVSTNDGNMTVRVIYERRGNQPD